MLMKIWNELCGSRNTPSYYPFIMFDPSQYVSWDDVDECLYRTDMKWELISPDGIKDEVPTFTSAWYGDYQETRYITHKIKKGYGFVITKYGRYNRRTNDLCREIENTLDVTSDLHIYGVILVLILSNLTKMKQKTSSYKLKGIHLGWYLMMNLIHNLMSPYILVMQSLYRKDGITKQNLLAHAYR